MSKQTPAEKTAAWHAHQKQIYGGLAGNPCACGCGRNAGVWHYTDKNRGAVRGEPREYFPYHRKKTAEQKAETRRSYYHRKKHDPEYSRKRREQRRRMKLRRRAQKLGVEAEDIDLACLHEEHGGLCGLCGEPIDPALKYPNQRSNSVDHIVPLALGGGHTYANTQPAHWLCNVRKGAGVGYCPA